MQDKRFRDREQERLYVTEGFSSYKLLTNTHVKQPIEVTRISGRVQERLYFTDGFSSPKPFTLTTYLG